MIEVERVVNGRYHRALGMTPFETFHANAQVHQSLVRRRLAAKERENMNKKAVNGGMTE